MRKLLSGLLIISTILSSCSKGDGKCSMSDSPTVASSAEIANVQAYLTANSITAIQHSSGFFYKITAPGSGSFIANLCSTVTVNYAGKLTNGTVFDPAPASGLSVSTASFILGNVIVGWQKGLPLVAKGGKITLYIPPSLGYGASAVGTIPANSILIFDIELVDIAN